ncbi:VanZ family protein [Senegalia massiliensis]|uniref:VanZ family protein n=1 Tax=Senegalia massiliensis TaxID=1720316 RepID=A0A845QYJ4_9CLOT|nr:VanZ family protein [Senegalia massiliensis]
MFSNLSNFNFTRKYYRKFYKKEDKKEYKIKHGEFKKVKHILFTSIIISLLFEILQLISGLGSFDVDDLILNTLGAVTGYGSYYLIKKIILYKKRMIK